MVRRTFCESDADPSRCDRTHLRKVSRRATEHHGHAWSQRLNVPLGVGLHFVVEELAKLGFGNALIMLTAMDAACIASR